MHHAMFPSRRTAIAAIAERGSRYVASIRFRSIRVRTSAVLWVGEGRNLGEGDRTVEKPRWLWLHAQENVPAKYTDKFAALRRITLATGKAWLLKKALRSLWKQSSPTPTRPSPSAGSAGPSDRSSGPCRNPPRSLKAICRTS